MSEQITITLTREQAESIRKLRDAVQDWTNRTEFLGEVANQQFDNGYEFSPCSWVGLGAILNDISKNCCDQMELMDNLVKQLEEATA